jgi:hypothetical protein
MDELRPWPTAPYVRLPLGDWPRFADARAIATVPVRMGDAEQKLLVSAHRLPGGGEPSVLMLRLGTGEEVALVGNPGIKPVTLLHRGPGKRSVDGAADEPADVTGADAGLLPANGVGAGKGRTGATGAGEHPVDGVGEGTGGGRGPADGAGVVGGVGVGAGTGTGQSALEAFVAATGLPATPVAAPRLWQGMINGILYALTFSRALDDAEVDRVAVLIIEERSLPGGPARHRAAIGQALASPAILAGSLPTRFSEAEFRDFLIRLLHELDERER